MTERRTGMGNGILREGDVGITVHGTGASIDTAIEVADATRALLAEVAREMGVPDGAVKWKIGSVQFQCDGCGLKRPDRPGPDEGWTYADGDDFCPACSSRRTRTGDGVP